MTSSSLEARVAHVEGLVGELRERFNSLEGRFNRLGDRMQSNFQWTIGLLISMWVTLGVGVVLKG